MQNLWVVVMYFCFYATIAVGCWASKSAWPLFALILTPSVTLGKNKGE